MRIYSKRSAKLFLSLTAVILIGLCLRINHFYHNIDGPHVFRQTMMTSNIYYFFFFFISTTTELFAKNHTHKIFDFPIYQQLATGIVILFKLEIVQAGRVLNIFIYLLTTLVLYELMVFLHLNRRLILIVIFLFSLSPLSVFYSRAVIPDNLPVLLGFYSLLYFLKWDIRKKHKKYHYAGMLITGILATLIKNPVYLPIVIAIVTYLALNSRWKQLFSPAIITFLITILATVIFFRLYSNYVNNGDPFLSAAWEHYWYFSNLRDRVTSTYYIMLIDRFFYEVVTPPVFFFFIVGIFIYQKKCSDRTKYIFVGLLLGSIITMLIFFNVMWRHNYYQIPYVFITCFFAGYFIDWFYTFLRNLIMQNKMLYTTMLGNQIIKYEAIIRRSMSSLLLLLTLFLSYKYAVSTNEQHWQINSGIFINQNTPANALIIYVAPNNAGWNPSYLYFARREGYNVPIGGLNTELLEEKLKKFGNSGFYLFIPKIFPIANKNMFQEFNRSLIAESSDGILFKFKNDFLK